MLAGVGEGKGMDAIGDLTTLAAQTWFGYGRWEAPYWFVGMEPGGTGESGSYESWRRLGGGELIDCRSHHLDCEYTKWHGGDRPPTQPTWRRLIQLMLAFKGEPADLDHVSRYQRDDLGSDAGETAIIELSALHAPSLDVAVERDAFRDERIATIQRRLDEHKPRFAVFYGISYRSDYERIVDAPFGPDLSAWRAGTLCVLTPHPVAKSGPPPDHWLSLGIAMRLALAAGPGTATALPTPTNSRSAARSAWARTSPRRIPLADEPALGMYIIRRNAAPAGRVAREGRRLRVEELDQNGKHRLLGYYEDAQDSTFHRKALEIDDVFDSWRKFVSANPELVKASWRRREQISNFREIPGALTIGCAVLEDDGIEIARIYKVPPNGAVWVSTGEGATS